MPSKLFGFVYFVRAEGVGRIKIGWTEDLRRRLDSLRTASPVPLVPIGYVPGTKETEGVIHHSFREDRTCGEWFEPAPDLLEFIREVAKPWPSGKEGPLSGVFRLNVEGGAVAWTAPYRVRCRLCSNVIPENTKGYRYNGDDGRSFDACQKCCVTDQGDIRWMFRV